MSEKIPESNSLSATSVQQAAGRMEESSPRMVNSRDLLDGRRELRIRHRGEIYRMLLTRNGKLMLQK